MEEVQPQPFGSRTETMPPMMKIFFISSLLSMCLTACSADPTQLIVVISSDLGDELHSIGLDVSDETGAVITASDFRIKGNQDITLPFSFTIEPGRQYKNALIHISALALDEGEKILTERSVRVGFVDQERKLLHLNLLQSCRPVVCGAANESCVDGACADNFIDVRTLSSVTPGAEFASDAGFAGSQDGGAGLDASTAEKDGGGNGTQSDAGPHDSSLPGPTTSCVNTGCPQNQLCVSRSKRRLCDSSQSATETCECRLACDPFGAVLRCGLSTDICSFLEEASPEGQGYCTSDSGGGTQNEICSAFFNSKGERTSDNCNRSKNFLCSGVNQNTPDDGRCTRVCRRDLFLNCQFLLSETTYLCNRDTQNPTSILGRCRLPPQDINDISTACRENGHCQSNACLRSWAPANGICTAACNGLNTCPSDSACMGVPINSEVERLCFRECLNDGDCATKNRSNVCHPVGSQNICYPRCELVNNQCPGSSGRCDPSTGHCE